jgi:4-aminobutyrate aminotransferase-like enzyme/Ser/Thr protein kinase RdoA (MazF antagonist)
VDEVLTGTPPRLTPHDAVEVAGLTFGLAASNATELGSERDQAFALTLDGGAPIAVLKVSNPSENPEVLDMEATAALHVRGIDAGLCAALPWRAAATGDPGPARPGDPPATLRARWQNGPISHWVRAYDVMPGASRIDARALDDRALIAWGETTARLGLALRGFAHPRAHRTMPWDVQHTLSSRPMIEDIRDPHARRLVTRVLDRFEAVVAPAWPRLRAQVIHGDLTVDNTLTNERGIITGIIDFGDMSFSALITELAPVLDSLLAGRDGDELFRSARLILDGYQRIVELEELELQMVGDLCAARSALNIAISSWRVALGLEEPAYAERSNEPCLRILEAMNALGWEAVAEVLGAERRAPDPALLAARRAASFGQTTEPLSYDVPLHVSSAEGVWITDTSGRRYLDAYNNVPCVGHGHPRVLSAIARQSRRINTHMRYLHPAAIELAERLLGTCPPELDTVMLVNSGSEANDLAWRMAAAATGRRGGLCTTRAYHGVTEATAALSPESWSQPFQPDHVERWEPPDTYRGTDLGSDSFTAALARLQDRHLAPAAVIFDSVLTSDRIADLDPAYVRDLAQRTAATGAMWIADEVQAGHGRTGSAMWSYERFGITPDFVTLGKPMGNGHPIGAVITRRELVDALAAETVLFSTFGGNPVSAAAGLAVLDVLQDERVLDRVSEAGLVLRAAVREVSEAHHEVGDVRGVGLIVGVELVSNPDARTPDPQRAIAVRDRLRHLGVLVGTTGLHGNVLKVRPPLAFTTQHVPILANALEVALADTAATR